MTVVRGQRRYLRRENRGQRMFVFGPVHAHHRFDARDGGGLSGNRGGIGAEHGDGDFGIGNARRAGDALGGGRIQGLAVVLADDEYFMH